MQSLNFNKAKSLNVLSGMPQMSNTLTGWKVPLQIIQIFQDVVEGDKVTTKKEINFEGVWQPLTEEQLQFKPEGQRSWEWIWIHAVSGSLNLVTQDKVEFLGKKYKVLQLKDYSLNGFIEYHLVRDYESDNIVE